MININMQDVNSAVSEVSSFILEMSKQCKARGYTYTLSGVAAETYEALLKYKASKNLLIADYGSDTSIYNSKTLNTHFRFYHDVIHLELEADFSHEGEMLVVDRHIQDARKFGLSDLALVILMIDTAGQVDYYYEHKKFVEDQKAFMLDSLSSYNYILG